MFLWVLSDNVRGNVHQHLLVLKDIDNRPSVVAADDYGRVCVYVCRLWLQRAA